MIFSLIMFVLLVVTVFVQIFLPSFSFAYGAHVYLVPTFFYVLALALPYPVMLLFAVVAGIAWDATHHVYTGAGDLTFGFTVVSFALLGTFIQGIRPLFRRGRWELPVLMIGLAVLFQLLAEYLLINFRRGGFEFPAENWFKMVSTSGIAMVMAPLLLLMITQIARRCGYQLEIEQFMFRKVYGHQI